LIVAGLERGGQPRAMREFGFTNPVLIDGGYAMAMNVPVLRSG
jgi:hypothetical protein